MYWKAFLKFLISIWIVWIVVDNLWGYLTKPFIFERFDTKEEAQAYFDMHYPTGSDVSLLLHDLEKAGARCVKGKKGEGLKKDFIYEDRYFCQYLNDFISLDPTKFYNIVIYIAKSNKIIEVYVAKHTKWS